MEDLTRRSVLKMMGAGAAAGAMAASPADNVISCHVRNAYSMGSRIQYQLMSGKKEIMLELTPRHDHGIKPGDTISLGWNADDAIFVTE